MTDRERSPYAVRLDDLVGSARVAPEDQVIECAEPMPADEPAGIQPPQLPNIAVQG